MNSFKNYVGRLFRFTPDYHAKDRIILRDFLALERTRLANERTLMAYIKASLYLLLGGIAFLQLEGFGNIKWFGVVSLVLSGLFVIIGMVRFTQLKRRLQQFYAKINEVHKED